MSPGAMPDGSGGAERPSTPDGAAADRSGPDHRPDESVGVDPELRARAQRRRLQGLAGASGGENASGSARQNSGPSGGYGGRVAAKVRPNIVYPDAVEGNPRAEVEVRAAPDGTIVGTRLIRSSGNKGWDEAVLGATTADPESLARRIRAAVHQQTELTCAVGIGETKERAKMATVFAKASTERVFRLWSANWLPLMGDRPVTDLWGIGKRTGTRLGAHGLTTVTDLATADRDDLAAWFGPTIGPRLRALARGGTSRTVQSEERVAKSRSKQVTFPSDLIDPAEIAAQVVALTESVCRDVFADSRLASQVGVIVRTSTFFTQTKTGRLAEPTNDPGAVVAKAIEVLARFGITRPVRLLGVRVDLA